MAISIRLRPEDNARLEELARRTERSKTFRIREAIHERLSEFEERFGGDTVIAGPGQSGTKNRPAR